MVTGIAHTRWATHGGATDANAHPHHDSSGRISVAHNGVIENFSELKKWLQTEHKTEFKSETDTEVIAQMVLPFFIFVTVFPPDRTFCAPRQTTS